MRGVSGHDVRQTAQYRFFNPTSPSVVHLWTALAIGAVALLGMLVFPGRTWLQADTQIYIPMFERLWDPSLYSRELITSRPHLAWTIYDDVALLARAITRAGFENILLVEQFIFRALAILGIYLIGRRFAEKPAVAMLQAAIVSLGATIVGPSVLSFEYEPVPRGFAVSLLLCAIGLAIHGETLWSSIAASVAFLYHAPTTVPFWLLFAILILHSRRWIALAPPIVAAVLLLALSRLQPGLTESQHFFDRIPPAIEQLQRLRAPYNWVSQWPTEYFYHYAVLWFIGLAALFRLRRIMDFNSRLFFAGLPVLGILSIPISYLMLEVGKLAIAPQWQPARAVLFVTVCTVILCCIAAVEAGKSRRFLETLGWFVLPFLIPIHRSLFAAYPPQHVILILALSALAAIAVTVKGAQLIGAIAAFAMAIGLIPSFGGVSNYARIHNQALDDLSTWARTTTAKDSVFLFVDPGKDLQVGVFRAVALRAVYVDWKAGGQVNYFNELGLEWWRRWQLVSVQHEIPRAEVDFVVYRASSTPSGVTPVYRNAGFIVEPARH